MSTVTEKYAALKAATSSHYGANKTAYKETAVAAATGVGAYFAAVWVGSHVEMLRNQWWATPALMAIGGHLLKKKNAAAGHALIGAAGYAGAMNYQLTHAAAAPAPAAHGFQDISQGVFDVVNGFEAGGMQDARGLQTAGFDDAGALDAVEGFDDAGSYDEAGDITDD